MMLTGNHLESRRRRAVRWTAAAVFIIGVHIGFAAIALMHRADDDSDDIAAGPIVVELAQIIEDEFGVELDGDAVKDVRTVGDVVDLVVARSG